MTFETEVDLGREKKAIELFVSIFGGSFKSNGFLLTVVSQGFLSLIGNGILVVVSFFCVLSGGVIK